MLSKAKMTRCTGPSARAIRSLSQGDPPARNCSSGEGRADSTGKEQRRQSTQAKNVRCEVECSTVRGLLFQALLRKLDGEVPKKLAQKENISLPRGCFSYDLVSLTGAYHFSVCLADLRFSFWR